jgi:hypothetical protein
MASAMPPLAVNPQAITLLRPKGASDAGSKKTPEPMVLPTTNATHIQKLRSCGRGVVMERHYSLTISVTHLTLSRNSGSHLRFDATPSYRIRVSLA